jgi:hypothetical protein
MKVWPIDPLVPRNLRLEVPEKLPQVVVRVVVPSRMDSSEENSPQSSQQHSSQPSAAHMLWKNTFPSSDSDVLYAVGESQQTSVSQAQEEDELMNEDVEGLRGGEESHEPWQNKKVEAFYDMVADIEMLKTYINGLKNTVSFGWCNLVLMATNKGEDSNLPNPESRKGYVQISYNKVNKVSI